MLPVMSKLLWIPERLGVEGKVVEFNSSSYRKRMMIECFAPVEPNAVSSGLLRPILLTAFSPTKFKGF